MLTPPLPLPLTWKMHSLMPWQMAMSTLWFYCLSKIYRMRITHGQEPTQVLTNVLSVKSALQDAKLLGEFFTCLALDTSNDHCDGIFLPKGTVHQLGLQMYEQMLKENNFFLTQVATIPVNLEYDTWFAVINQHAATDNKPISLYEHLIWQTWFQWIELVGWNKCLIVTTCPNLPEARVWIDANLEVLIRKLILTGIDPLSPLLPKRLDKPVYTSSSQSYMDVLKKQFSLNPNSQMQTTEKNRPPCKQQATIIDYNLDQSVNSPLSTSTTTLSTNSSCNSMQATIPTVMAPNAYATELLVLKQEICQLKNINMTAIEQIMKAVAALQDTQCSPLSNMDTDSEHT